MYRFFNEILENYAREMTNEEIKLNCSREQWTALEASMYLFNVTFDYADEICEKIQECLASNRQKVSQPPPTILVVVPDITKIMEHTRQYLSKNSKPILSNHIYPDRKQLMRTFIESLPHDRVDVFSTLNKLLAKNYHKDFKEFTNHELIHRIKKKFKRYYSNSKEHQEEYKNSYPFLYQASFPWYMKLWHSFKKESWIKIIVNAVVSLLVGISKFFVKLYVKLKTGF